MGGQKSHQTTNFIHVTKQKLPGIIITLTGSHIKFRFELISAPFGSTLDPERGLLRWKAISNLVMDKWTEAFIVKAVGGCGEQTFLEVTLDVLRCHCQNGGHCRTDMSIQDGSPVCQCPKGFTGLNIFKSNNHTNAAKNCVEGVPFWKKVRNHKNFHFFHES